VLEIISSGKPRKGREVLLWCWTKIDMAHTHTLSLSLSLSLSVSLSLSLVLPYLGGGGEYWIQVTCTRRILFGF
jgi:hypothetical protein